MEDLSIWSVDDLVTIDITQTTDISTKLAESGSSTPSSQVSQPSISERSVGRYIGRVSPQVIREGKHIPPDLMLDGARAIGAFCRPYPIATVGMPTRLDFDIKSSKFELHADVDDTSRTGDDIYTEIYVPYVHYATDSAAMSRDAASTRPLSGPVQAKVKFDALQGQKDNSPQPLELDLKVDVSEGRFEIHGQYLRWWYKAPEPGQGVKTVKIVIHRKSGPILARVEQSIPSWGDLCPIQKPSCAIM